MSLIFTIIHTLIAVMLIVVILMQSGRGGGLTEGFASAESMFGAKTNAFMVKATTVLSCFFLMTSLALAYVSSHKEKSLMDSIEEVSLPLSEEIATMNKIEIPISE